MNRTNNTKDLKKKIRELAEMQDELIRQMDVLNELVIEEEEKRSDLDVRVSGHKVFKPCFKV